MNSMFKIIYKSPLLVNNHSDKIKMHTMVIIIVLVILTFILTTGGDGINESTITSNVMTKVYVC